MRFPLINSAAELEALVMDIGFLPLFHCRIPGFSVADITPQERWFVKDVEGPWEWREALADGGTIAYAKVFERKAGFVSPDYYPDLANWRRGGLDFDTRYESGLIHRNEKRIMDALADGPLLSRDLKSRSGLVKGFDGALTSLQMRTDVVIRRLEYKRDAFGKPYGMGSSRFCRSDDAFGEEFVSSKFDDPPEVSLAWLTERAAKFLPDVSAQEIAALLR